MTHPTPQSPMTTARAAKVAQELANSPGWRLADDAIAAGDWILALDTIQELDNTARSIRSKLSNLAGKAVARHWHPLLSGADDDG